MEDLQRQDNAGRMLCVYMTGRERQRGDRRRVWAAMGTKERTADKNKSEKISKLNKTKRKTTANTARRSVDDNSGRERGSSSVDVERKKNKGLEEYEEPAGMR